MRMQLAMRWHDWIWVWLNALWPPFLWLSSLYCFVHEVPPLVMEQLQKFDKLEMLPKGLHTPTDPGLEYKLSGTNWNWAHDGMKATGKIKLLAHGAAKWQSTRWQWPWHNKKVDLGSWHQIAGDPHRICVTFNGQDHILRLEDGAYRAVVEFPQRTPPSQMFLTDAEHFPDQHGDDFQK